MSEKMNITDAPDAAWHMAAIALVTLDSWDWERLLDARRRADTVGHIVDPTGYRDLLHNKHAAKNLELAKAIASLVKSARASHPEIFEQAISASPPAGFALAIARARIANLSAIGADNEDEKRALAAALDEARNVEAIVARWIAS